MRKTKVRLFFGLVKTKVILQDADSARESRPRVGGGAERSEAEGLLETKKFAINLSS